jgi:hypothetical protein
MKRIGVACGIALVVALASLGWTWLQRREGNLHMARTLEASRRHAGRAIGEDTGTRVRITQFYAKTGEMTNADRNIICYGVVNAKSVRMDPPVENLAPSRSRCIWVEPKKDTTYTLFAEGLDGTRDSASFQLNVKPAPPHIQFVAVSHSEIRRGEPVTVCYGVDHAKGVRLDPLRVGLPPLVKNCTRFYPKTSLKYTLVAFDALGRADQENFSIQVK